MVADLASPGAAIGAGTKSAIGRELAARGEGVVMETWQVSLISLVAGFFLAAVPRWFDRRRNVVAYWKALREEIEYCQRGALGLMPRDGVAVLAPLGRLSTVICDEVLPHIVAEDEIDSSEIKAILAYYDVVRQVNASLDISAAARERGDEGRAREEFRRMTLKVARFAADHPERIYAQAIEIANRHCRKPWWRY